MIRDSYKAAEALSQNSAFARPNTGGQTLSVKAMDRNFRFKPAGTISRTTIDEMFDLKHVEWLKGPRVVLTAAGKKWFMDETIARHA